MIKIQPNFQTSKKNDIPRKLVGTIFVFLCRNKEMKNINGVVGMTQEGDKNVLTTDVL